MQKIKSIFPLILFLALAIAWSELNIREPKLSFSFDVVHSLKLRINESEKKSIFTKFSKGTGIGTASIDNSKEDKIEIRLGGESSKDTFYETQDFAAATLHLKFPEGPEIKTLPLYEDPSLTREYLAYEVFSEFFEMVPEYNFVKASVNDESEKLFLAQEKINQTFFERRKMMKVYHATKAEDVRHLITSKAYTDLLNKFDQRHLLQYLLFSYVVDDQDGPFSGHGYTENARILQDKILGKYILVPDDLDQTFACKMDDIEDQILEIATLILKNEDLKKDLRRVLMGTARKVLKNNIIEHAEAEIHEKLLNCCEEFLDEKYQSSRAELLANIQCHKQKFSVFVKKLKSLM